MDPYSLPDLAYDHGALEPYYTGELLELHHDKHHAAYVAGANTTLARLAATTVQGSGWGVLAWEPLGRRLVVEQVHDHHANLVHGAHPLLVLDAWEHAYYLQYRNDRAAYVDALRHVVDWADIAARFDRARHSG